MKRFASVAGAIALAAASVPAAAMDYSWRPYRNQIVIDASGEIVADEAKRFIAWVEQSSRQWNGRKATAIVFNSPGGIVKGGVDMGLVVADFHMITGRRPWRRVRLGLRNRMGGWRTQISRKRFKNRRPYDERDGW